MSDYLELTGQMQRMLRRNGHSDLARRISRAIGGGKTENEIIDRVSLVLERIKQENASAYRLIRKEATDFFRLFNNLWV